MSEGISIWDAVGLTLSDPAVPQNIKAILSDAVERALSTAAVPAELMGQDPQASSGQVIRERYERHKHSD
jgi:hypothetical protein